MTESPSRPLPRRILRRAANLLTSNGQPVPAVQETILQRKSSAASDSLLVEIPRNGTPNLSASIKKKFQTVKRAGLARSKSLKLSTISDTNQKRTRHSRAQSDVLGTRPGLVHTISPPVDLRVIKEILPRSQSAPDTYAVPSDRDQLTQTSNQKPSAMADVTVPQLLRQGTPMTKVSAKRQKTFVFRLDPDQGQILWESKKHRIIPIENIKEIRSRSDAKYYREHFQLSQEYEDRWLTIVYILDGQYKTLHVVATTRDVFRMWDTTLRKLYGIRQELMTGLGNLEMRQAIWEKQYWKRADEGRDQRLDFDEVERLCKRLNINSPTDELMRLFKQADRNNHGFLYFPDFQRFVKLLKARPELDQLYKKICRPNTGKFDLEAFSNFMRNSQKSSLSRPELERIFSKYCFKPGLQDTSPQSTVGNETCEVPETGSGFRVSSQPPLDPSSSLTEVTGRSTEDSLTAPEVLHDPFRTKASPISIWTLEGFAAFLLSQDNSAFADQHGRIWHDMTRPLSDYYISSSHNTYLVGHQLVGVSTIEGYIRALLHGCRSVELDIYDGDTGPVIFHGKTFTSKVSLLEVCQAIARYAFVASPYPIIISAEIHCSLTQQDMMVEIMQDVFGGALVSAPLDGHDRIQCLPSPEDLKGRVLLKAKNLYVSESEAMRDKEVTVDTESSTTETSASDSEVIQDIKYEWHKAKDSEPVRELKQEFQKARNAFERTVRPRMGSPSPSRLGAAAITTGPTAAAFLKPPEPERPPKVKMSFALAALLVYTVGVKCRGINKKEVYAPEHVFSLSENTANKILKQSMTDLIKHNRTHLVRIYPKGLRLSSTNFEPHRYWSAGAQLVAINWQTFDLGYMINHAMFQRNGRSGYVLKPLALRTAEKEPLSRRTKHLLDITIISAQQLPRPKDSSGHEIIDKSVADPYVEVSVHVPDWTHSPFLPPGNINSSKIAYSPATSLTSNGVTSARTVTYRTSVVKNNGFNPVWHEQMCLPFDCVGDMRDLIFVRFAVKQEGNDVDEPLALYCTSLGSLQYGYRHLPLHDSQLSQYLFSTLFVKIDIHDA